MDQETIANILNAAGSRADAVQKVLVDAGLMTVAEAPNDTDAGQPEAEAEGPNAAVEGGEAEEAVPAEAQESE